MKLVLQMKTAPQRTHGVRMFFQVACTAHVKVISCKFQPHVVCIFWLKVCLLWKNTVSKVDLGFCIKYSKPNFVSTVCIWPKMQFLCFDLESSIHCFESWSYAWKLFKGKLLFNLLQRSHVFSSQPPVLFRCSFLSWR